MIRIAAVGKRDSRKGRASGFQGVTGDSQTERALAGLSI